MSVVFGTRKRHTLVSNVHHLGVVAVVHLLKTKNGGVQGCTYVAKKRLKQSGSNLAHQWDIHNLVTPTNFRGDQSRGGSIVGGQILPFSTYFYDLYNTVQIKTYIAP